MIGFHVQYFTPLFTPKKKRVTFTISKKVEISLHLDAVEATSKLLHECATRTTTDCDLKTQKEQILKFYIEADSNKGLTERKNRRKSKSPKLVFSSSGLNSNAVRVNHLWTTYYEES